MLQPTLPPPRPAAPPAAAPSPLPASILPATGGDGDASGFAKTLERARQERPAEPARDAAAQRGKAGRAQPAREAAAPAPASPPQTGDAQAADKTAKARGEAEAADGEPRDTDAAQSPGDDDAPETPSWLPGWMLQASADTTAVRQRLRAGSERPDDAQDTGVAMPGGRRAAPGGAGAGNRAELDIAAGGGSPAAGAAGSPADGPKLASVTEPLSAEARVHALQDGRHAPAAATPALPTGLGAAGSAPLDHAPAGHETPAAAPHAPFEAHLAAAIDSPAFAPALGAQVSLLVRDGIQEARLQLNPADMGPIAVQIELQGRQAHVEFSADLAATRQALEASLPDLAAALNASGLTLAGGGVFEQPRGRDPQADPASPAGAAAGTEAHGAEPAVAAGRAAPRGVVDLVA